MICPRCETSPGAGRQFCAECVSPLARTCSGCGMSSEPGVMVCGGSALENERKQVTVLFADLKGSMKRPADRAPPAPFWVPRVAPESEEIGGAAAGTRSSCRG